MHIIKNFERMGEENAFAVLAKANALAAAGKDVINLGIGQPDFPTPENIVEAAVKALRDGLLPHHHSTPVPGPTGCAENCTEAPGQTSHAADQRADSFQ